CKTFKTFQILMSIRLTRAMISAAIRAIRTSKDRTKTFPCRRTEIATHRLKSRRPHRIERRLKKTKPSRNASL
ncbi:MAG: hypothetical protein AVDCRST_MAG74-449, partial [uncultured Pyrinomonadaceae bacterium]